MSQEARVESVLRLRGRFWDFWREVANLWRGGAAFEHFFCPLAGEFDVAHI